MDAPTDRLRPIDLARAAGISTQQVRNHADEGVLPPTSRTDSGYRILTDLHRRALLTFRALSAGFGGATARGVMAAVHEHDLPAALALIDAAHHTLHEQRTALHATGRALAAVAEHAPDAPAAPGGELRIGELAAHLGVRTSTLRVWEDAGLLEPRREHPTGYRLYSPADVREARMVHLLRQVRYPLSDIPPVILELRRSGDSRALHTALGQRADELTQRSRAMLTASALLDDYARTV
ncbi:MerR family transcriptional regulator [Nocardiopsis sp. L17-MgMaSL7]|uniref:MerR family transcriptional regulator n=1 Tax=Nocardiopsis sp. L17-MgMaSL7 TaxID=1938893 RepID=UPI000D70E8F8|nr:MerR family transcriptional regulator [Nocardiopsis sp. L17-MgMaSL7]PWV46832.1 DNA-binding transcriptional MerR regulator [Nocardiopsis sp. L17-MgMaSL7]